MPDASSQEPDTPSQEFEAVTKEIVKEFLQTVVIVDDKAFFGDEPSSRKTGAGGNPLDAKEMVDGFAKCGMICSILKPEPGEEAGISTFVMQASKRADVVILDWRLLDDLIGKTVIETIKKIREDDEEEDGRLRLIVIYSTSEPDRDEEDNPFRSIHEAFPDLTDEGTTYALTKGKHFRIAFKKKEDKDGNNLPEFVISEFAKITAGILSNVALKSISVIRDNTHLLLGSLGTEIDPAYLAHRALLPFPDDAMDHAVEIVASELQSILENYKVGEKADKATILIWLNNKNPSGTFKIYKKKDGRTIDFDIGLGELTRLLEIGFEEFGKEFFPINTEGQNQSNPMKVKLDFYGYLTKTFCFDQEPDDVIEKINCEYAVLASQKNHYGRPLNKPMLTLGTVLRQAGDGSPADPNKYWICIQPRCDCVRINASRTFIFLPLFSDNKKGFGIVLKTGDGYSKYKITDKNYEYRSFVFPISDKNEKIVRAKYDDEEKIFYFTSIEGEKFVWVTELKNEHAQRVANEIGSTLSRVGVNESEWLRLWCKRG